MSSFFGGKYAGVNLPPGDSGLPIIGHALQFAKCSYSLIKDAPPISTFRFLSDTVVAVKDPVAVETLVRGEGRIIEENVAVLAGIERMAGPKSLMAVQGDFHKKLRTQLLPAFSTPVLERTLSQQQLVLRRTLKQWRENGKFDVAIDVRDVASDFGCIFIGVDVIERDDAGRKILGLMDKIVAGLRAVPIDLPGIPTTYKEGRLARQKFFEAYIRPLIASRRDNPLPEEEAKRDMISVLISAKDEDGEVLDQQACEENLLMLVIAAIDTTYRSLIHFVRFMCLYPEVQDKLRQEINTVLAELGPDEEVTNEHFREMPYLDQVLAETLRLGGVTSGSFFRKAKKDFELGGYTIPKGMSIRLSHRHMSLHPDIFTDPLKFDPERFAPDGEGQNNKRVQLEFGFGTRMCIGKRVAERARRLFAVELLRSHRISSASGEDCELSGFKPLQHVIGDFTINYEPIEVNAPKDDGSPQASNVDQETAASNSENEAKVEES